MSSFTDGGTRDSIDIGKCCEYGPECPMCKISEFGVKGIGFQHDGLMLRGLPSVQDIEDAVRFHESYYGKKPATFFLTEQQHVHFIQQKFSENSPVNGIYLTFCSTYGVVPPSTNETSNPYKQPFRIIEDSLKLKKKRVKKVRKNYLDAETRKTWK